MKLLNDERIAREDGEIRLTLIPVTTSQQARLIELGALSGVASRIALTHWCLKNCIETLSVNGEDIAPAQLAEHADLSDNDTLLVMLKIGSVVCAAAFPSQDDIKKSPPQPAPGA